MKTRFFAAMLCSVVMSGSAGAKDKATIAVNYGAQPTFSGAVAIGEAYIKTRLVDPDSAKFEWPYNFRALEMKGVFSKRRAGYVTCGYVNSRNRMGGYSGRAVFYMMQKDGAVIDFTMDESKETVKVAEAQCAGLSKNPGFLPAPSQPAVALAPPPGRRAIGIQFSPTQIGALVMTVAPDSPAASVGIKIGQIIVAVNGTKTAGMGPAEMILLIQNAASPTTFSMMDGVVVTIDRPDTETRR